MKTLVYGIDGMSLDIMKVACPAFYDELLGMCIYPVNDDVLGRGWSKIITGKKPQYNNSYFQMPLCDGTYKIDKVYNLNTPGADSSGSNFEYLWEVSDRLNLKSVFVNIPTTSPSPKNNGIFISGIGGGRYPKDGMDSDLYHPSSLVDEIARNYMLDIRLKPSEYPSFDGFCSKLSEIHQSQSSFFADSCEKICADFGFYVNKLTVEILNLGYYDVVHPERSDPLVRDAITAHFKSIYRDFSDLKDRLRPDNVVVVSDHGTVGYRFDLNVDVLLNRLGFLDFPKYGLKSKLRSAVGRFLPSGLKSKIKKQVLGEHNKRLPLRIPAQSSKAFSTVYDTGNFCGVYLNDGRFGGDVESKDLNLIHDICDQLNRTPEFRSLELQAVVYDDRFIESPYSEGSPDIWVKKPDGFYGQRVSGSFLSVNSRYGPIPNDISNLSYPNTGLKSSNAIVASTKKVDFNVESLTDAYKIILFCMGAS